jgi:hypothetical protein
MMEYRTLTLLLTGIIVLLVLTLSAFWRASIQRIGQLRAEAAAHRNLTLGEQDRANLHERRAKEFFGIIEGVEKERDTWQKLYQTSSHQSGVAQAWLLRDLSATVRVANDYAQKLRAQGEHVPQVGVDPRLGDVLTEFSELHMKPGPETKSPAS